MSIPTLTPAEKEKLISLLEEGYTQKQRIEDLRQSLSDTVTAVAKDLNIKKAVLNKAINAYYKDSYHSAREDFDAFEEILAIAKKI